MQSQPGYCQTIKISYILLKCKDIIVIIIKNNCITWLALLVLYNSCTGHGSSTWPTMARPSLEQVNVQPTKPYIAS